ncbi:MAG: hypothetical protein K8T10_21190 [Candidatus Eremiobacteraeota bacterium]|nr:hypothetical protein [Candidatus Eremiobacteraeota bacterium]
MAEKGMAIGLLPARTIPGFIRGKKRMNTTHTTSDASASYLEEKLRTTCGE